MFALQQYKENKSLFCTVESSDVCFNFWKTGEHESDALAAGSCEEEASRDPDSPELLNFFLTSSPATGSEIMGWGQLWSFLWEGGRSRAL